MNPNWRKTEGYSGKELEIDVHLRGVVFRHKGRYAWFFGPTSADFNIAEGDAPTERAAQECVEVQLLKLRDLITKSFEQKLEKTK